MSLAIYRKYRPRLLKDLRGQDAVAEILGNAARRGRIAHAYLFYGPRGSGKTTAARILAKLANCETRARDARFRETGEPCNHCRPCIEIDEGRALDVVEIDAASNRGIDEIRALKETIGLSPTSHAYRVFIVDEAHQLTKDAWNALLKTLEEPPPHAIFILATTEYEKIPATITSRAQRFHFKKLPIGALTEKLSAIVAAEKIAVDAEALELIAASAEGSFRDAESLLDQLAPLQERITLESVEKIIGKVGHRRIAEFASLMLAKNLPECLRYLASVQTGGWNVVDFTKELIHYLRRALSLKADPTLAELFTHELTGHELAELLALSERVDFSRDIPLLKSLIRAWSEMRYAPFAAIPLEVALIEALR